MSTSLLVLLVICIFAAVANAGSWQLKSRIVGGLSAVEKRFPYQVSLRIKSNDMHFCGASIIKPTWIVTAAHCFFQLPENTALIYGIVNKTHASEIGTRIELLTLIMHPKFGVRAPEPDIALIRTKDSIVFSEFVQPINLPTGEFIKSGIPAVVSGWGMVEVWILI
ncbi:tryptase delta-like [Sitodiplosis mosellana]|uniref:tryptase delta-like n=1 Tax=Sitodiplosis mosellana TaxID=263140 RepID=UPI00244437B3|nr:tryptase delta-like [Sitodiplosis mosellana]